MQCAILFSSIKSLSSLPRRFSASSALLALSAFLLLFRVCFPDTVDAQDLRNQSAGTRIVSEDTAFRGNVVINGSLTVLPQATLRLEPGAAVRFVRQENSRQLPRLVVMGRIICAGTKEQPVTVSGNANEPAKPDWGGILLLGSEKKNQLDQCRISGAYTAVEARNSTVSMKNASISRSPAGIALYDSSLTVTALAVNGSETAIKIFDSELDIRESKLLDSGSGIHGERSSIAAAALEIRGSSRQGLFCTDCRVRIASSLFEQNQIGGELKGGEGSIRLSRFSRNREAGVALTATRTRLINCSMTGNMRDGVRVSGGQSAAWGCVFAGNEGFGVNNAGLEDFSAVQNWWGTNEESAILQLLYDSAKNPRSGTVHITPWLTERPSYLP